MKIKRVINIFGGPGVGKSYITSGLFQLMKKEKYIVEMTAEYAKELTYEEKFDILQNDQLYIFAEQHRRLYRLIDKVDYVITDCPLLLGCVYFEKNRGIYSYRDLARFMIDTYKKYPNINILLKRNSEYGYDEYGRYQKYDEALTVDEDVIRWLGYANVKYTEMISDDTTVEKIFNIIKEK
jgi:hypothetical protein